MRAIIHEAFGAPDEVLRLAEVAIPTIGRDEVLVRVRATAVAKGDWLIATGLPYVARPSYGIRTPRHRIAGLEFAGVVEAIGDSVTRVTIGDEVVGWGNQALAERVAVPETQLAVKPADVGFEAAAALPVSGFAALQAVRDQGGVAAGDRVLILGASGGVGSFAVQIAKALGAEVTGVASTRNLDLVGELGADHVIDYTREHVDGHGQRYDVIIDIAGNRPLRQLRRVLRTDGTLVIVGGSGGPATMGFGRTIRATLLSPFVRQRLRALISKPNLADLETLIELAARGVLTPRVDAMYPLPEAAAAIELVGAGRSRGKTVVTV
ncbi:MAG: NAD(P)-dependent alcohol dehydrogenase [Acidimicrobiaceae bacterium]|nr:NAD(P)-dependent alcohol dehydrogenase [Acidimicrobiaceae bacterium]